METAEGRQGAVRYMEYLELESRRGPRGQVIHCRSFPFWGVGGGESAASRCSAGRAAAERSFNLLQRRCPAMVSLVGRPVAGASPACLFDTTRDPIPAGGSEPAGTPPRASPRRIAVSASVRNLVLALLPALGWA